MISRQGGCREPTFIGIHGNGKTKGNFIGLSDEARIRGTVSTVNIFDAPLFYQVYSAVRLTDKVKGVSMRLNPGIGMILLLGADVFALSGIVRDTRGGSIQGARVSLVSDTSIHRTTNAAGEFTIDNTVSVSGSAIPAATGKNLNRILLKSRRLHFFNPSPSHAGAIILLTSDGRKCVEMNLGPLQSGSCQITLPKLATGVYIVRIVLDSFSGTAYLIHTGNGTILLSKTSGGLNVSMPGRTAAAEAAMDTLLVEKEGFMPAKSPIISYNQTDIEVVMTPSLPPATDYNVNGPFTPVVENNVGPNGAYAIVRPDVLGKDGFLHAPIIYGYGINGDIKYAMNFLKPLASHGFVIIACNKLTGGPNSPANNTAMTNGLDWLLEQNSMADSKYQGKLAVTSAISMGYSVGGTAAVDIGGHKAIKTVVSIHGHISDATLHGTLLQTTGTKDNVGLPMQQKTFENSKVQTFLGTVTGADHSYPGTDGRVERPAIIAWLRYWIYNDTGARHYFFGNDCVMCKAPWENPQRKNWQ